MMQNKCQIIKKNRLKLGKFVESLCIEDEDVSKVNDIFDSADFSIEKDWNKLIHSRNIARSIIDKLLSDSKLTPDMIRYVFFIGTNKTTENKEDIVIETQDGKQYSFFLNKNVSTSKSSSFNKLADDLIGDKTDELFNSLQSNGIRVKIDNRENMSLGFKLNDSEVKGIPMRVVIGEKEIENNQFEIFYRYNFKKVSTEYENLLELLSSSISSVQSEMISESKKRLKKNTHEVNSYDEFKDLISNQRGFVIAGWDGTKETEEAIKIETKATIRCIPEGVDPEGVTCIYSGKPARYKVIFSKSY